MMLFTGGMCVGAVIGLIVAALLGSARDVDLLDDEVTALRRELSEMRAERDHWRQQMWSTE